MIESSNTISRRFWKLIFALLSCLVLGQSNSALADVRQSGAVDSDRSRIYVLVGATGFGHKHGAEGKITSGAVRLGANANAGEIVFDMKSFVAETRAARKFVNLAGNVDQSTADQVTTNMRGTAVLDANQFPQAKFQIDSASPGKKPGQFLLAGKFTLHGVTRPLQIVATAEEVEGQIHLHGEFPLVQTQFGIKPYSKALGAVGVADELKVWGDLWLAK